MEAGAFLILWFIYTLMLYALCALAVFGAYLCVSVILYGFDCIGHWQNIVKNYDALGDIGVFGCFVLLSLRFAWLMWDLGAILGARLPPIF